MLYTYREGKAAFRRDTPRPFDTAALPKTTIKLWKAGANDIIQTRIYESFPKVRSLVGPEAAWSSPSQAGANLIVGFVSWMAYFSTPPLLCYM